jgi:NAD(P)-dependent dehydrogenase (short-subunit alcohol dehydrogenase family)
VGANVTIAAMASDRPSDGRTILVTGAGGGIGRALAVGLAKDGADVVLVGRRADELADTAVAVTAAGGRAHIVPCDLAADDDVDRLVRQVEAIGQGRLAVLAHSAAIHVSASIDAMSMDDLDMIIRVNIRAPFRLTRSALPMLRAVPGDVVFINSSAAVSAPASNAAYAASKAALRAFADSLRAEINVDGVRVLSVFPGRTASVMQESIFRHEGRPYRPELLLQPADVAMSVVAALALPRTAELTEIHMRPAVKSY